MREALQKRSEVPQTSDDIQLASIGTSSAHLHVSAGRGFHLSGVSAEIERARRKRPDDLNAYDLYLRALPNADANTCKGRIKAIELLGKALAIDPRYAGAHGLAAWCHIQRIWTESAALPADLASALAHARAVTAIRTDDANAISYARAARDYETAIQMSEHALAQHPSNAHAHRRSRG
jgi:tetratricopeptide (TPR) repeat protein